MMLLIMRIFGLRITQTSLQDWSRQVQSYNPLVYAMTALICLIYMVLKLVWFFHLQHQPVGDEEDDMEMEEMETAGPHDSDSEIEE